MPTRSDTFADAWRHQHDGRSFEAAALCHQLLGELPQHAGACHLLGVIAHRLGQPDAATAWIARAIAADDGAAQFHDDLGAAYLVLGRLDDAAASHRRALALTPDRAETHIGLGKVLRARGRPAAAAAAFERALALMPDCAEAHFNLGNVRVEQGDKPGALDCYRQALALRPDFADAHTNLGLVLFGAGRFVEASLSYRRALALAPSSAAAHNNLGNACERLGEPDAAVACFERAIALDPGYVAPRINLGNFRLERGDPLAAVACYERAIALAPDQAEAHRNLGLVRLLLGDLAGGWPQWRWPVPAARRFAAPHWHGESLEGAPILLHAEQGFGDTLHFVRYVPLVAARGGRVILELPLELCRLLGTMAGAEYVVACGETLPDFAWECSLLSLPLAFATELATIPAAVPYITPGARMPSATAARGSPLRVGLVWAGRPEHNRDRHRSLPLAALAPLAEVANVAFHSLQKGQAAAQIAAAAWPLVDLAPGLDDFTDTAAAIAGLDLVITVDTAVAHLAGAMGRPVWLLLSYIPDWRWLLGRNDSPWYPTARLFRQPAPGEWGPVVAQVAAALADLVAANGRGRPLVA